MSKFRQIYAVANRLGLDMLPASASDEEQIANIAEQLGIDYDGTEDAENAILDSLYDMEADEENPYDNGYDEETVESFGDETESKRERKEGHQKEKTGEQGEETGGDGEGLDKKPDGQKGDGAPAGDGTGGDGSGEKGPNDNGYDPNRTVDDGTGNGGNNGGNAPQGQGGDGTPAGDGTGAKGSTPGDTNPNNDVNKNGSRPGLDSKGGQTSGGTGSQEPAGMGNRNFQHNQRVQQGKKAEESTSLTKKSSTGSTGGGKTSGPSDGGTGKTGGLVKKDGLQSKTANAAQRKARAEKAKQAAKKTAEALKKAFAKIFAWLASHPWAAIIIVLGLGLILILLAIIADDDVTGGGRGNGPKTCSYELAGVVGTGKVELTGLKVELINCDGTASNYTVLETVDFEKYVLGVALAEIGPDAPDEALKAQIVAARNFALTRNSGMCPGNPDDCFYGYNESTGKIRMRACEADQVYWNYNEIIYREDRGAISLYSPEINSGTIWKSPLDETRKAEVEALAEEVKGKVLLDDDGNVFKTSYNSTTSNQFTEGANNGDSYDKILSDVYGVGNIDSARCASAGNIDYGDYTLSSDGHTILHEPLDQFLEDNGTSLEEFNELIAGNVEDAGFGTRAGVVAAAVTLIGELGDNYGVKVPYYWGGGHYDGVIIGAHHYWGSDPDCTTYANNQTYDYCGLDCSGFVPWAIKNGGFGMNQMLAGQFKNVRGVEKVTLRSGEAVLEPGDLLESSGHIVLVVAVDEESRQYICAEASGNAQGVLFTRRSFNDSGYWGVKMDGYYNDPSNIRSQ